MNLQVSITSYEGFKFLLPAEFLGRNDIEITVEYAETGEQQIGFNAWARLEAENEMGLVYGNMIPGSDNAKQAIISHLGDNKHFVENTHAYIHHCLERSGEECGCGCGHDHGHEHHHHE